VRIALATPLGGDIDGAWWPHSGSVAAELPGLIEALHKPLGEIIDMSINWSATEGPPDLNSMRYAVSMPGQRGRRQRLMVVSGRRGCAKLLVVPHLTTPALGLMLLRRAAAMRIPDGQQNTQVFLTADSVVRAAQVESASWATRAAEPSRNRQPVCEA
jgi:mRNA-degrading endonuclease toxin of MazEF toxin-antitoxin module